MVHLPSFVVSGADSFIDSRIDTKMKLVNKKIRKYMWTHPKKRSTNGFRK